MSTNTKAEELPIERKPQTPEQDAAEDLLIRRLLLGSAVAAVIGVLFVAVVITVMISVNFNFLNWME
jgi:hypothetical protein